MKTEARATRHTPIHNFQPESIRASARKAITAPASRTSNAVRRLGNASDSRPPNGLVMRLVKAKALPAAAAMATPRWKVLAK